jgi:hypothetical protein
MSIKTWMAEFYPVSASKFSRGYQPVKEVGLHKNIEMLNHSILKWTGLLPQNIKKHGVYHAPGAAAIFESMEEWIRGSARRGDVMSFSSATCALCQKHFDHNRPLDQIPCWSCPLYKHRGANCDANDFFIRCLDDPQQMIDALTETRDALLEEVARVAGLSRALDGAADSDEANDIIKQHQG